MGESNRSRVWVLLLGAGILLLAGYLRFHGLDATASRSDELNQIHYVLRNQPVMEIGRAHV